MSEQNQERKMNQLIAIDSRACSSRIHHIEEKKGECIREERLSIESAAIYIYTN